MLIKTKLLKTSTFLAFKLSDVAFSMLINVKMPTIVEKSFITSGPDWFQSYLAGTLEEEFAPDDAQSYRDRHYSVKKTNKGPLNFALSLKILEKMPISLMINFEFCKSKLLVCIIATPSEVPREIWASTRENLSSGFGNNKGTDQPAKSDQRLCLLLI